MNVDLGGDPDGGVAHGRLVLFAGPRASSILSESGRLLCFGAAGHSAVLHSRGGIEPCDAFPAAHRRPPLVMLQRWWASMLRTLRSNSCRFRYRSGPR